MTWPGLPILLRVAGEPVILLGKGEAADAKRRVLERAGAIVVGEEDLPSTVRPGFVEGRPTFAAVGRPSTSLGRTEEETPRLAIVAIEDEGKARDAVARLRARGLLVNAVDRPELCDFTLPAVVDRAPVLVAVMTGGTSAGLAAALRQRLEVLLPASLGRLAEALADAREALRARYPNAGERRRAIGTALAGPLDPLDPGAADRVAQAFGDEDPRTGLAISLTSADPDDLTLRQARALALADRVLHAPHIPPAILARARADAIRVALPARPRQLGPGDVWVEVRG